MHGIAPTRAIPQRTASAVLFFLAFSLPLAVVGRVWAQEAIYRCGHEYTNAPRDASRCERLPEQSVTVIPGVRPHAVIAHGEALRRASSPPAPQHSARTVLAQNLARVQKQHQAWAKEVEMLLSQAGTAEFGAAAQSQDRVAALQEAIERAERDIDKLTRELAQGPQTSAHTSAQVPTQAVTPMTTQVAPITAPITTPTANPSSATISAPTAARFITP